MTSSLEIQTERFFLKLLDEENATSQYLSWLNSSSADFIQHKKHTIAGLVEYIKSKKADEKAYLFGIFTKEDDFHIGNVKFEFLDHDFKMIEMGILIGETRFQGIGVAPEVIKAFAKFAKVKFSSELMLLGVSKKNKNAISSYRKIGFEIEKSPLLPITSEDGLLMSWKLTS